MRWYERAFRPCRTAIVPGRFHPTSRLGRLFAAIGSWIVLLIAFPLGVLLGWIVRLVALPFLCVDRVLRMMGVLPAVEYERETSLVEQVAGALLVAAAREGEVRVAASGKVLVGLRREEGPTLNPEAREAAEKALTERAERGGGTILLGLPDGTAIAYHKVSLRVEEGLMLLVGQRTAAPHRRTDGPE